MLRPLRPPIGPLLALTLCAVLAGCGAGEPGTAAAGEAGVGADAGAAAAAPAEGPRLVALGTAQDGGLPHAGCTCERCEAARRDPHRRRRVASLALVLPGGESFLVDATPDLPEQLHLLRRFRPAAPEGRTDRRPVDGVLLTHAHMGHYLGLAHFGFEVLHTRGLPVYCTPRMAAFLSANGPWDQLVRLGNVELRPTPPGTPVELGGGVRFTPLAVPHRDEYSDTVAYLFEGPRRSLLYVPDTDSWSAWERPLTEVLEGVDAALLDGTFYSPEELPGRDVSSIGHPLITRTLDLLAPRVEAGTLAVYFTHLNHSNPALDPASEARRTIESRGFHLLADGQELAL